MRFLDLRTPPVFSVSYLPVTAEHLPAPIDAASVAAFFTEAYAADDVMIQQELAQLPTILRHHRKLKEGEVTSAAAYHEV